MPYLQQHCTVAGISDVTLHNAMYAGLFCEKQCVFCRVHSWFFVSEMPEQFSDMLVS